MSKKKRSVWPWWPRPDEPRAGRRPASALPAPPAGPSLPKPAPAPALPAPKPAPSPALPAPPSELPAPPPSRLAYGRADYRTLPRGPYDPHKPLPWDDHVYPPTPAPPALPASAQAERAMCEWLRKRLWPDEQKDDQKKLPPGDPPITDPRRQLPSAAFDPPPMGPAGIAADRILLEPVKGGLFGKTPLELLDAYLDKAGIRYFTAKELTAHKWRHAPGAVVSGASAWWFTFDLLGIKLWPTGPHQVLPRHVVPDPALWPKILPVLRVLDRWRHWLDKPTTSISSYRHPLYNEQIEGAKDSRHMTFEAVDFYYPVELVKGELHTDLFVDWFAHLYRGNADGVGRYKGFVHLDINTRGAGTGKAQNWDFRNK